MNETSIRRWRKRILFKTKVKVHSLLVIRQIRRLYGLRNFDDGVVCKVYFVRRMSVFRGKQAFIIRGDV